MDERYLLKTRTARNLYERIRDLPLIDYHNHLSLADLENDRLFSDLTELWIAPDPYKHRLMRICGIEEHFITGDAAPYEKFEKFCTVFPRTVGTPIFDWSRMELSRIFGIKELPTRENASRLFARANEMLASREFSANAILSRFGIAYQSPVVSLLDSLSLFDGKSIAPSLRGDGLLAPQDTLKAALSERTGVAVTDESSYIRAVSVLLDRFAAVGCRFADHALDAGFFASDTDGSQARMLVRLAAEYKKRGFTLLLHMDAKRKTSTRLARLAGPAGGYAAAGDGVPITALCDLLNAMEEAEGLPDTVLFPLNLHDAAPLAILEGSFSEDRCAPKVQLGPAWWWCDHSMGIRHTLDAIASFGVISSFIGMTTDSRSILSFIRHEYFRRVLCAWLAEKNEQNDWGLRLPALTEVAERIAYKNALDRIKS